MKTLLKLIRPNQHRGWTWSLTLINSKGKHHALKPLGGDYAERRNARMAGMRMAARLKLEVTDVKG